ncbi:MAG: glycosyltransferase family 1 protein [Gemmatimonadetes bacterium]|nr:MAG: glycosyltransferase family 1 protein [Gemmatimonadota bacterium]
MRIALVAEDYYPQLGGVPEHVHNLALQLNAWGHPTTVITSHMGDHPDPDFVRRVGTSRVIYANGGVSRITTGWKLRRRLEQVFRAGRYDIVHVHGGLAPVLGLAAPLAAWRAGIPVVATFHSWFPRSDVIPNGVDTTFFRPNGRWPDDFTDDPRLLFLGRIEPRNGLGTLLDAMPRILARYPGAVLTVAGDGPWRRYYERRARELGGSVRFAGQVFRDRPAFYNAADLYLCPTTIASFGVTLLEAMACGTPMIVSDNLGFRSVIDGGAEAVIIPKDGPQVWADTTIALLADPARRAAMGRAGVAKAASFAWPRIAGRELAVYERVLTRRGKANARPVSEPRYVRAPRKTSVIASTSR